MRLLPFFLFFASGCTMGPTSISTNPSGATVIVEGYGECVTPCSVLVDSPRNVTVAKAGFKKQQIILTPDQRRLTVDLELAAPTSDVAAGTLPPLN